MKDDLLSARDLYEELDKKVVGQKEAKKALSVAVFLHMSKCAKAALNNTDYGSKSNLLLIGPTGCGKTFLLNSLEDVISLPIFKISAKDISQMGFKGMAIDDYMEQFFHSLGGDDAAHMLLEHAIIFIDEIDKLCYKFGTMSTGDHNGSLQHTLLKTIEGTSYYVEGKTKRTTYEINTSRMLFVLGGNFQEVRAKRAQKKTKSMGFVDTSTQIPEVSLHKELIAVGLKQELAGRLSKIVELKELSRAQLVKAMTSIENSPVEQYKEIFNFYGKDLRITKKTIDKLVDECYTNGTGARGLHTALDKYMEDKVFNLEPENIYYEDE